MITTGIHIPASVQKKLTSAVASVHRETERLTFADFRNRARVWGGRDGTHPTFFSMTLTKRGAVKEFDTRLLSKPGQKFTPHGFEADVPMFGPADMAVRRVMPALAEYLIYLEVEYRKSHGLREMIKWTDEDLQVASNMRSRTPAEILRYSYDCGTVSEVLRSLLAEQEIGLRERESHHGRVEATSHNMSFLERCQKSLSDERRAAQLWSEDRKANGWWIDTYYTYDNRCEDDRILIAYRDMKGW
ncbi:hypothetical protein SAMN05444413_104251 [Roseivivax marinus]|uniref:hypothetical protein n=1 Tax=Roseivivax marinus TaxID=1379903 RepID=UPI0008B3F60D|nr:hypothetical protein [Roseivivax marinus]SEK95061.1 hypothetical protein SAMN05444413_104251 [Roseivivax marinus]